MLEILKLFIFLLSLPAELIPSVMMMIISVLILKMFNLQPNKGRGELKELRMLCAEDEQGRTCWMTAFRLFKVTPSQSKFYIFVVFFFFFLQLTS